MTSPRTSGTLFSGIALVACLIALIGWPGCGTPVCRSDGDCQAPTPRCVLAQCKACKEDADCTEGKRCDAQAGLCVVGGSKEPGPGREQSPDASPQERITPQEPGGPEPPLPDVSTPETPQGDKADEPKNPDRDPPKEDPPKEQPPANCQPGATAECYDGPRGTQDKGPCKAGTKTCEPGGTWGACVGQVLPTDESCDGIDNNCDGKVDEKWGNKGQSCSAGQGLCLAKGTYICNGDGKSTVCDARPGAPKPEVCDKQDNDCDGSVDEGIQCACNNGDSRACGSDVGYCRKGTQTCSNGKWSDCRNQRRPRTETCNNQDDNCDGQTDEGLTRDCFTARNGCQERGGSYSCQGACKAGTQTCQSGSWGSCQGQVLPSNEVCDGKDNDCDGSVDEGNPGGGGNCTLSPPSACGASLQCESGKLTCLPQTNNITESCRNNQDDDCDGKTDEICGPTHGFAVVSSNGSLGKNRDFSRSAKNGTGRYTLYSNTYRCGNTPMFALGYDGTRIQLPGVSCSGNNYQVSINGRSNVGTSNYTDSSFWAVAPARVTGEIFGRVDVSRCSSNGCPVSASYGQATVRRLSRGVYEITATPCTTSNPPIFATPAAGNLLRGISAELRSGKCILTMRGLLGNTDDDFAFWLPNPTTNAYAVVSSTGSILAKNDFADQKARWAVSTRTSGGYTRYTVTFPAWANPSAPLAMPYASTAGLTLEPLNNGIHLYPYSGGSSAPSGSTSFAVLFVQ